MKKIFIVITSSCILNSSFSQETLQSVTSNGSETTNSITTSAEFRGIFNGVDLRIGSNTFIGGLGAFGTNSNHPIAFFSNTLERMRVLENGNVGIGTTSPLTKFHVYTNSDIYAASFGNELYNLRLAGTAEGPYGYSLLQSFYNNAPGGKIILQRDAGNVGIGTTSPACKLDVNGNTMIRGQIQISQPTSYGQLSITNTGTDRESPAEVVFSKNSQITAVGYRRNRAIGGNLTNDFTKEGMFLFQGGKDVLFMELNGPAIFSSDLNIDGNTKTRKIKVTQTDWPDYVFDTSYQLTPLPQVEKYIQTNKHLPEVPSVAEVKKEGLDLGDNQALLLKKIEELTLYILQQHKEFQSIKEEMKDLKSRVK